MEKQKDIHNYQKRLDRTIERVSPGGELTDHNSKIALGFKNELLSQNISISKTSRYLQDVIWLHRQLEGKNFDDVVKEDVKALLAKMNQSDLAESTKKGIKIMLRKFYKYIRGVDDPRKYPEEVDFFTLTITKSHSLMPEELLNEQEMMQIIRAAKNERDKALMAVLCESGCRVGEVGTLRIKHISFEEIGVRITVKGKTGMRKILLIKSAPFLQIWLNNHPIGDNPEAPMWIGPNNEFLSYARIKNILRTCVKKAGIKKRVYPHLLRHSRATILAKTLSDANMKNYLGWAQGSKMASVYIHMSGKDTDEAILRTNGIEITKEETESPLKPKSCLRCNFENPCTNKFCSKCGLPLDEETARRIIDQETTRSRADRMMDILMQDEEIFEIIKRKKQEIISF
jgi:site-specific recombinase XerD